MRKVKKNLKKDYHVEQVEWDDAYHLTDSWVSVSALENLTNPLLTNE